LQNILQNVLSLQANTSTMATTKFYLDLRGKAKDGKGTILIVIAHNRTTTTISTGVRVSPGEWNGDKVVKCPEADPLNIELIKQKTKVDTAIAFLRLEDGFEGMTAPEIKESIGRIRKACGKERHLISDVFAEYLEQDLSEGTKGLYCATLDKISSYVGDGCKIEDVDYKWIVEFEKFLAQSKGVNGRSIDLRNLRAVCNYALKTKLITNYPFENFSIKQEATKKRCVDIETLRKFYSFPCKPYQIRYRDIFFLMFFLIGINAKDLLLAKPDSIRDGRLEYIRRKTHKNYSIKIEPETDELLKKYKGFKYLINVMDSCKDYHNFLHEMNDALGQIGPEEIVETEEEDLFGEPVKKMKVNPIIPDVTSYFARHTWSTLAYQLGIQIDVISQALGHSMGNKTTLIYIKPDQEKVDAANRKVIDFLLNRS